MANKRKLTDKELEGYANMSEDEWDNLLPEGEDSDSDEFIPSNSSSGSENSNASGADEVLVQVGNTTDDEWIDIHEDSPLFTYSEEPGLKIDLTNFGVKTLVDLFFSDEFLNLIVTQTNIYAQQEISQNQGTSSARKTTWKDTNITEMKTFLGLLFHMGPVSLPTISLYWNKSIFYNMPFWRSVMSRNRFQLLLRYLHFADNSVPSDDRLYKVRLVLSHFNDVMSNSCTPQKNICIDESMMLWRGRLFFRQYIQNKKHKYGVKLYKLCESDGLIQKTKIYCGKTELPEGNFGHATGVVLHLMEDYLDKGYILHMDNFYNSVALTELLTDRKIYVCGTLRGDRKGNPKCVINQKLKKGELIWKRKKSVVVCKWKDKRDVLVISNKHKVDMTEVCSRNGKKSLKPNIVHDYNTGVSGV